MRQALGAGGRRHFKSLDIRHRPLRHRVAHHIKIQRQVLRHPPLDTPGIRVQVTVFSLTDLEAVAAAPAAVNIARVNTQTRQHFLTRSRKLLLEIVQHRLLFDAPVLLQTVVGIPVNPRHHATEVHRHAVGLLVRQSHCDSLSRRHLLSHSVSISLTILDTRR